MSKRKKYFFCDNCEKGENFLYGINRKGNTPPATFRSFSAIYDNQMFVIGGGTIWRNNECFQDPERIYSLNLGKRKENFLLKNNFGDLKPVNEFINKVIERRGFDLEELKKDQESLQEAQKLLEENKKRDIIFRVGGQRILAHKNILSLRSSYFANMFSSNKNYWS